jgi:translation elongation factor EF-Ts
MITCLSSSVSLLFMQAAQAELLQLGSNLAMHSAGMSSQFISRHAMPQAALDAARADLASATEAQMPGKPTEVRAKIVDGKVAKWCKDVSGAGLAKRCGQAVYS